MSVAGHWPGLVHGLVADAPGDFPNGPYHGTCRPNDANTAVGAWTLHGRPVSVSEPLPVAHFHGPVLLVSGGQDAVWPSALQADQLMRLLPHDGAAHVHLNYPAAGHEVLGAPYYPAPPAQDGGTPAANEAAYASDWPAMLRFTARH